MVVIHIKFSKEDYIEYHLEAAKYEVSVITELDTPAHSALFSLLPEMYDNMYDIRHLKILDDSQLMLIMLLCISLQLIL